MTTTDITERLTALAEFLRDPEAQQVHQVVSSEQFAVYDLDTSRIPPSVRDGQVGPWDTRELDRAHPSHIDLGGLKIPYVFGMKIRPEWDRGAACAVNLAFGSTEVKLEVLHMAESGLWHRLLGGIRGSLFSRGVTAETYLASLGVELRADVPNARRTRSVATRYLGCEGPGWLLRATVEHPEDAYVHHHQIRRVFVDAIVDLAQSDRRHGDLMRLQWPPVAGWDAEATPLY